MADRELRQTLSEIAEILTVVDVTASALKTGLKSSHKEFEDAIQIATAQEIKSLDYIITRNLKDFKTSAIPAISILELLVKVN
ncbi:hypothetical protein SAMN03080598_03167 [Algoriphagus boritolerans DSM 17298 = JCM 18970]|uniref:PIN domain-containing protein n=1 Tax=Algoriphagus boritolerans DSM 17298 = JCM 18970 TaxID=1120964 RepID=A0A1H5YSM8_9BACT|nr:hypothetical protein SAMN03080598_03167 [Algoriphagus boritolerans DSM 17298 = JCM 18970]